VSYYSQHLSASRLQQVYDLAPPRIVQYLQAEIDFVRSYIKPGDIVLDLGCGYGRIIPDLLPAKPELVIGIDSSIDNICFGVILLKQYINWRLLAMDAANLSFKDNIFDLVICIQNGLSAFKVKPGLLLQESLRVCKKGGFLLFSTYSPKFCQPRLQWFKMQSEAGLLGEIDWQNTKNGLLACKDGFKSAAFSSPELIEFTNRLNCTAHIIEVDESSLFLELKKSL